MPRTNVIALATPTLGQVHMMWTLSVLDMQWPLNCTRTLIPVYDQVGGQIAEMRNRLVQMALDFESASRQVTHLAFLDDDVLANRMWLLKLLQHDRDIASGCYFTKTEVPEPLIFPESGNGTGKFVPDQEFEVYGWSMGLCVIRMEVFKRIRDECKLPTDLYGNPSWFHTPTLDDATFTDGILGVGGTEDFPFFRYCHQLGIKALQDTSRYAFGFHQDKATGQGYPLAQWNAMKEHKPVSWRTRDGILTWNADGTSTTEPYPALKLAEVG